MKDLIEILTWCRGAGTQSEKEFVAKYIATCHKDIWPDEYGNWHLTLGHKPTILWSCHTDTVTRKEGRQNVKWVGKGMLGLNNGQHGQCLGADNGAGVWIMLELIKANKAGHYVFHRDEEIGGIGSQWVKSNQYVIPQSVQCAIAMDRNGPRDIITHQGFQRCCSDDFAISLAEQLPSGMMPDDGGIFTDTANYVDFVHECTNLGCGYERNHGKDETLDVNHLRRLRDALLALDESKLVIAREAGTTEYSDWYGGSWQGALANSKLIGTTDDDYDIWLSRGEDIDDRDDGRPFDEATEKRMGTMEDMVKEAPDVATLLLKDLGITADELRAHIFALKGVVMGV